MSAILMTCPTCGQTYIAGVVGATPWPQHVCPPPRISHPTQRDLERGEELAREHGWE